MPDWLSVDWAALFVPKHGPIEIILRGTLTYIALFLILRFLLKRQTGVIGIADLLVVVLIADAAQNAMARDYESITEGVLLVLTIVFWNFAVDWIGYRFPALRRLTRPPPLLLVEHGRTLPHHLRHEMITMDELMSQMRQQGVADLAEVERAFIEGDGRLSVIKRDRPADEEGQAQTGDRRPFA